MTEILNWHGCYDEGWRGLICDAAFAHPAKAARGLVRRIFTHMEAQGWLPPRSRVLDVFGGIGTTAIEGASRGHEVVCVELEERFYKLALENFQLHRRMWESAGDPLPVMLLGDSRKAVELVRGHFAATIGSSPYADQATNGARENREKNLGEAGIDAKKWLGKRRCTQARSEGYGQTPGQIGAMPEGSVDAAIASPPYAETPITGQGNFQSAKCPNSKPARDVRGEGYTDAVIGSPPYAEGLGHGGVNNSLAEEKNIPAALANNGYGGGKGNIANLAKGDVDAVLSSPPYEQQVHGRNGIDVTKFVQQRFGPNTQAKAGGYGNSTGQLAEASGETFWLASRTILEQVHQLLKPGGMTAWIVKDYVKAGKRVTFCDNWSRLCEATGFRVIQRARCHLVKEETNPGLFGDVTKKTERKSFFRRLHERKPGAVRIDFEEVIFAVRL